jgi:hypothetical protein
MKNLTKRKKLLIGFTALVAFIILCFAIDSLIQPYSSVSEAGKEQGELAIEIIDDYLDFNITGDEARRRLEKCEMHLGYSIDKYIEEHPDYEWSEVSADELLKMDIGMASSTILGRETGYNSVKDVKEYRSKIKDQIR